MGKQSEQSFKIVDFLRFPLIMVVVLIHCNYPATGLTEVQNSAPIFYTIQQFLQHHIYTVAVPLFFFISGYLFFRNGIPDYIDLKRKLIRRLQTLLIPYILWNTIGMCVFLLKTSHYFVNYFPQYADLDLSILYLIKGFIAVPNTKFPYDLSLWFLRNLIIIIGITPLLCIAFKKMRFLALLIPIVLICFVPSFCYGLSFDLFYFMIGGVFSIINYDLCDFIKKVKWISLITWIILIICTIYISNEIFYLLCVLAGIFASLYVGLLCIERNYKIPCLLTKSTFFIYAFHALFISFMTKICLNILPTNNEFNAIISYLFLFLNLSGGSILVFYIFNRLFPKLTSILTGKRS